MRVAGGSRFSRIVAISLPAIRESAPAPYGLAHFFASHARKFLTQSLVLSIGRRTRSGAATQMTDASSNTPTLHCSFTPPPHSSSPLPVAVCFPLGYLNSHAIYRQRHREASTAPQTDRLSGRRRAAGAPGRAAVPFAAPGRADPPGRPHENQ